MCKFGCGKKVAGYDMDDHEIICPKRIENCQKCKCPVLINNSNEAEKHNCIEAMKQKIS